MPISPKTRIIDLTIPLSPALPTWPGDPPVIFRALSRTAAGEVCNATQIVCPTHCGTHVDPPWHFIDDGANLDAIPLDRWVGPCQVVEFPADTTMIGPSELDAAEIQSDTTRVLFKTANSQKWHETPLAFSTDYVALSVEGARWIIARGLRLIGIDYFSFAAFTDPGDEVHRSILGNGIVAIEGLNLTGVAPGHYDLVCLPLKVAGGDGAPARVILLDDGER